jgi:transcriptional regulator with XRE-family HTH domain
VDSDLALRADVDRNHVPPIELGRNSPRVRMGFRLCEALDVKPSDLLKDVEGDGFAYGFKRADQVKSISTGDGRRLTLRAG